jgi:hypothetical protein
MITSEKVCMDKKAHSFYNLILGVKSHIFYCIQIFRSQSIIPANTQMEGISQRSKYQQAGIIKSLSWFANTSGLTDNTHILDSSKFSLPFSITHPLTC